MKKSFVFIDETGVLHNSSSQRFFALGLIKCADTSIIYENMVKVKSKIENFLFLNGKKYENGFEFKFKMITKTNYEAYKQIIDIFFDCNEVSFYSLLIDKQKCFKGESGHNFETWDLYIELSKKIVSEAAQGNENVCVIADYLGKPNASDKFYSREISKSEKVFNAVMIESHASLFIQLVDVIVGCIVFNIRKCRTQNKFDEYKNMVSEHLIGKLKINSISGDFECSINEKNFKIKEISDWK